MNDRSGMVIVWVAGAILVGFFIAAVLLAAPRSASDGSPRLALTGSSAAMGQGASPDEFEPVVQATADAPAAPRIRGTATHYCLSGQRGTAYCTRGYGPDDLVAAIDTDLGFAKGDVVLVRSLLSTGGSVTVRIVDVCGCPGERLIDLTSGAFRRLAPLGLGVIPVTIELAGTRTLPPTETAP